MASAGADWKTNPVTQMTWGANYIKGTYGNPVNAISKWLSRSPHWYSEGGVVPGGHEYARGGIIPEPVAGYGLRSGQSYRFAENGPETVIPGTPPSSGTSTAGGGTVVNFQYLRPQAPSPEQQQALFLKASAMIGVS